jgi:serine/threonine protein kinase
MFVMKYYEQGSLYSFLDECMDSLCWRQIVNILWDISSGIKAIHELGLIHGNLHGGNVLIESDTDAVDAKVADAGLIGPVDKEASSKQVYGVIPFVAPEILSGSAPSKKADIYSFGMIMWMLSSGLRPHHDKPHDIYLSQDVCIGLRPTIVVGTPPVFAKLMLQCLDDDPSNRPTAFFLYECLGIWIGAICDDPIPNELSEEFDKAEEEKYEKILKLKDFIIPPCHEESFYFSRPLTILNVRTS